MPGYRVQHDQAAWRFLCLSLMMPAGSSSRKTLESMGQLSAAKVEGAVFPAALFRGWRCLDGAHAWP